MPDAVLTALRALPTNAKPMDALRTAVSAWGATQGLAWPPTVEQARALTAASPSALAAFARIREGKDPIDPDPSLDLVEGFLYQLKGERPDAGTARALDAYFIVGAEHGFNASTFTARVVTSTQSDLASAVCGAIGTMKGPLHGGAPSEVVDQLAKVGSVEHAEAWLTDALDRGERLMGFGHRVYRAYDPRAAALRKVAEGMEHQPEWLELAIQVEDVALRLLAERHPDRPLKTNVEYYAAPVLMGVGLTPGPLPGDLLAGPPRRLDRPRAGAGGEQPPDPPGRPLRRPRGARPARPEPPAATASRAAGRWTVQDDEHHRHQADDDPRTRTARSRPGPARSSRRFDAMSVSGRRMTDAAVRTRSESFSRCDSTDSFVDSSASATSL